MTTKITKSSSKLATKKKVSSKKTSSKSAAPAESTKPTKNAAALTAGSHIRVVAGSREPVMPKRKAIKKAVPAAGIKASALIEKTDYTLRTLAAMIRRGFIEARSE